MSGEKLTATAQDHWHYLSFVTGSGPTEKFAGGAIVRGAELVDAVKEAHRLGCNPGGSVLGCPIPADMMPPEKYRERLLTKDEINQCWDDCRRLGDILDEGDIEVPDGATLCASHNEASRG